MGNGWSTRGLAQRSGSLLALSVAGAAYAGDPADAIQASGMLQVMGTVVDQDRDPQADPGGYGDPEADPGLAIQRARLGLDGQHDAMSWQLVFGMSQPYDSIAAQQSSSALGLIDANGSYRFGADAGEGVGLSLTAGLQKVPFSREEMFSAKDLVFLDRGVGSYWLNPTREIGLVADLGTSVGLRARAGLFNGNGSADGDDNTGKMFVGRVEWGKGDAYKTWSASAEDAISVGASVLSDTDLATGTLGVDVDALWRSSRTTVWAQGSLATLQPRNVDVAPPEVLAGTKRVGATGQLSYFLPLGPAPEDTDGVEFAARVSWFDAATGVSDNGDVVVGHLGATWRDVRPGLDLGAGFIHREELGGQSVANDTVRVWAQVRAGRSLGGAGAGAEPIMNAWRKDFVGTWRAGGDLDGALVALWEQPGLGLVGSFQMNQPRGKVVVGRPYPLDSFMYADRTLRVRMDPYGEGRDLVWFELTPSADGQLCGYGYEDGRRSEAVAGTGGGSWICWSQQQPAAAANATAPATTP